MDLFHKLIDNFLILGKRVMDRGDGHVIFEWPQGCALWSQPKIKQMIQEFDLKLTNFHGCSLGLRASDGNLIKKPWRLASNVSRIMEAFSKHQCSGDHVHTPAAGKETANTAFYPVAMTDLAHDCMSEQVEHDKQVHQMFDVTKRATDCVGDKTPVDVAAAQIPDNYDLPEIREHYKQCNIFDLYDKWILDTGSGQDLVKKK